MTRTCTVAAVAVAGLILAPASAQDPVFPPELTEAFVSGGEAVANAASAAERLAALQGMLATLEGRPDIPSAAFTATLIESQIAAEDAIRRTALALQAIGAREGMSNAEAELQVVGLIQSIAALSETVPVRPSDAIRIADAIAHYDATIGTALGRPLDEALSSIIGDPERSAQILAALADIRTQAADAEGIEDLASADAEATARFARRMLDLIPSDAGPAFDSPATVMFGDLMEWSGEMWATSSEGMDIVADGIETGTVDAQRLRAVEDRLDTLRQGPWGSNTVRRFAARWCDKLTIGAAAAGAATCHWLLDALFPADETANGGTEQSVLQPGSFWQHTFADPTAEPFWNTALVGNWQTGLAPFGTLRGSSSDFEAATDWPADGSDGDDLWVRKLVDLTGFDLSSVRWYLGVDNGFTLYINGYRVDSDNAEGFTRRWEYSGDVSPDVLRPGINFVAVALEDHGGETAFDMEITATPLPADAR